MALQVGAFGRLFLKGKSRDLPPSQKDGQGDGPQGEGAIRFGVLGAGTGRGALGDVALFWHDTSVPSLPTRTGLWTWTKGI